MDCCLVPFLPAVMVAVEQLEELEQRMKEERAPIASEASIHLTEMAAAVSELEADRSAVREQLEAESIENSRVRDESHVMRESMRKEIKANVDSVTESRKEEMDLLHKDLNASIQLREDIENKLQDFLNQNKAFYKQREQVKSQREVIVASLNDVMVILGNSERKMRQTQEMIDKLKSSIAANTEEMRSLEGSVALEKASFSDEKERLLEEVREMKEKIKDQLKAEKNSRRELIRITEKKDESLSFLRELKSHKAEMEVETERVVASWRNCNKQLEEEIGRPPELLRRIKALRDSQENWKTVSTAISELHEQISKTESKIEEALKSKLFNQKTLAQVCEQFSQQTDAEEEVRSEHGKVAEQLEAQLALLQKLPQHVESRTAAILKYKNEIAALEEKLRELREEDIVRRRLFKRSKEEVARLLEAESELLRLAKDEMRNIVEVMEETQKKQEEHDAQMRYNISNLRRIYEQMLLEQTAMQRRIPECLDMDLMKVRLLQSEKENNEEETGLQKEVEQFISEVEGINIQINEKQKELEEKEELLKEVEEKWGETLRVHGTLKELTVEQSSRLAELHVMNVEIKERTKKLLQPKEDMKAELEELRRRHLELLGEQASELMKVEVRIYEDGVNLEQVAKENARLRLVIGRRTADVRAKRQQVDRDRQEVQALQGKIAVLLKFLPEAFRFIR